MKKDGKYTILYLLQEKPQSYFACMSVQDEKLMRIYQNRRNMSINAINFIKKEAKKQKDFDIMKM